VVQMENLVQHLEELSHESTASQPRSISEGSNNDISGIAASCVSAVASEQETAGQHRWSLPAAEADDDRSQGKINSSLLNGVSTTVTSPSASTENLKNTSQADENHNMKQSTEVLSLKAKVDTLQTKIDTLNADLHRSDNVISQLKRHIELNTASEGSQLQAVNPEIIITLVHEVERLNTELDKRQAFSVSAEDRSDENMTELASVNDGRSQSVKQGVDKSTSPLSMQSLDSTLTAGDTAAVDSGNPVNFGNIFELDAKTQVKLPMKDKLLDCNEAGVEDGTSTIAHPLLAAAATTIAKGQQSFLASPAARNVLRQSIISCLSPVEPTSYANQRKFAELQAEVERLRCQLQFAHLENSRLLEHSARESVDSVGRLSFNPPAEMSLFLDGSLVKYSASGDVTVAAGFLKKLVNVSVSILLQFIEFL